MDDRLKRAIKIYDDKKNALKIIFTFKEKLDVSFYNEMKRYDNFKDCLTEEEFKDVLKYKVNRNNRRRRANKKISIIQNLWHPKIVFGTCTFDDSQFTKKNGKEIKEITRTKKVNEWISSHFEYAVVNIDYGKKTEREHHHFVGVLKEDECLEQVKGKSKTGYKMFELKNKDYKLGFEPTLEKIEYDPMDYKMKRLSNYLLKINNHENKLTTKNRRFRVLGAIKK